MVLGHRDDIGGNGASPNVIAEQRRSKYELSVLQHVILLQRLESCQIPTNSNRLKNGNFRKKQERKRTFG